MSSNEEMRIAIRKFPPFEKSVEEMWADFVTETGCPLRLTARALDLPPLHDALLSSGGLQAGDWDIAQINSDWIAEAHKKRRSHNSIPT